MGAIHPLGESSLAVKAARHFLEHYLYGDGAPLNFDADTAYEEGQE